MSWSIGNKKVKRVTKFNMPPSVCAMCGNSLAPAVDPYNIELEDGSKITLCDTCGRGFCHAFGITAVQV